MKSINKAARLAAASAYTLEQRHKRFAVKYENIFVMTLSVSLSNGDDSSMVLGGASFFFILATVFAVTGWVSMM